MLVSGKQSILDGIFRICGVAQELESPLVKHRQVARHDAVQFLSRLAKSTRANFLLLLNERCYCRHNGHPSSPSNSRVFKATQYQLRDRTRLTPAATPGPRQPAESGLTSL